MGRRNSGNGGGAGAGPILRTIAENAYGWVAPKLVKGALSSSAVVGSGVSISALSVSLASPVAVGASKFFTMTQQLADGTSVSVPVTLTGVVPAAPAKYPNFPQTTLFVPRQLSDFNLSAYATGSFVNDASFTDGRQVFSATPSTSSVVFYKSKTFAPVDIRNGSVTAWAKINPFSSSDWNTLELRLYSSGSPTDIWNTPSAYHKILNPYGGIIGGGGFLKIGGCALDMTAIGGGADLSAITWVAWAIRSNVAGRTVLMSDIQFVPNPRSKAAVIFRQDDAWKRTGLRDLFASYGVPWTQNPGAIAGPNGYNGAGYNTPPTNNPDRWAISDIDAMRASGALQVGTQAWSTEANQANFAAYLSEMQSMQQYYKDRGWVADAADGTYYTNVNFGTAGARQAMLAAGSRTIQRFNNGRNNVNPPVEFAETFPFRDETAIQAINLAAPGVGAGLTPPITTITDSITITLDLIVARKGVLIIAGHQDMYDQAAELAAIQYVLDRWQSGGGAEFDILTMNQLLDPYVAQYGGRDYAAPNY